MLISLGSPTAADATVNVSCGGIRSAIGDAAGALGVCAQPTASGPSIKNALDPIASRRQRVVFAIRFPTRQSARSACTGSIDVARRAGRYDAAVATPNNTTHAAPSATGSVGL